MKNNGILNTVTQRTNWAEYSKENKIESGVIIIALCSCGKADVKINDDIYEMTKNSVIILSSIDERMQIQKTSFDFQVLQIAISGSLFRDALAGVKLEVVKLMFLNRFYDASTDIHNIIRPMYELLDFYSKEDNKEYFNGQTILILRSFMIYLQSKLKEEDHDKTPSAFSIFEQHFKNFIASVQQNYMQSREVMFYANELGITSKHLNVVCKKMVNKSAKMAIDEYVVSQLKSVLKNTDKSIQEISDMFNFPNQSFMGKYFKKTTGLSPKQFREGK